MQEHTQTSNYGRGRDERAYANIRGVGQEPNIDDKMVLAKGWNDLSQGQVPAKDHRRCYQRYRSRALNIMSTTPNGTVRTWGGLIYSTKCYESGEDFFELLGNVELVPRTRRVGRFQGEDARCYKRGAILHLLDVQKKRELTQLMTIRWRAFEFRKRGPSYYINKGTDQYDEGVEETGILPKSGEGRQVSLMQLILMDNNVADQREC
jgi:hypothetical protein